MGDIEFYEKQILQYAGRFGSMPKEFLKPQGQKVYHIFCGRKEDDKNYMLGLCGNYFFDDRTEEDGFDEDYYMCEPAHKPLKEGQVKCVHCMKAYATGLVDDFMTKLDWGEYCVASLSQENQDFLADFVFQYGVDAINQFFNMIVEENRDRVKLKTRQETNKLI